MTNYEHKTHLALLPEYFTSAQARAYLTAISLRRWSSSNVMERYLTGLAAFEEIESTLNQWLALFDQEPVNGEALCAQLGMSVEDYTLYSVDPSKFKAMYACSRPSKVASVEAQSNL